MSLWYVYDSLRLCNDMQFGLYNETLLGVLLRLAETVQELSENLKTAIASVKSTDHALVASIASGCELFLRFITLTALDSPVSDWCNNKFLDFKIDPVLFLFGLEELLVFVLERFQAHCRR